MIYCTGIHATWNWKPNNLTTVDFETKLWLSLLLPSHERGETSLKGFFIFKMRI